MKPRLKLIAKYSLYVFAFIAFLYALTYIPSNYIILVLGGLQVATIIYIKQKIKKLDKNQKEIIKLQKATIENLGQNQRKIYDRVGRLL